jgi:hypothetical protein
VDDIHDPTLSSHCHARASPKVGDRDVGKTNNLPELTVPETPLMT